MRPRTWHILRYIRNRSWTYADGANLFPTTAIRLQPCTLPVQGIEERTRVQLTRKVGELPLASKRTGRSVSLVIAMGLAVICLQATVSASSSKPCIPIDVLVPYDGGGTLSADDCRDPRDNDDWADVYRIAFIDEGEDDDETELTIRLESDAFIPVLYLLDIEGGSIERDNAWWPGDHAKISEKVGGGTYHVLVTERNWSRGATGEYVLRISGGSITAAKAKDEIAKALYNEAGDELEVPYNETRHDYNDYGCPYIGLCKHTDREGRPAISYSERARYADDVLSNGKDRCREEWVPGYRLCGTSSGYRGGHSGWDINSGSHVRSPFYSLTTGLVITAGGDSLNTIAVYDGMYTVVYLHAQDGTVAVKKDKCVEKGDVLGTEGNAGTNGGGIHVHISVQRFKSYQYAIGAGRWPGVEHDPSVYATDPLPYLYNWVATKDRSAPLVDCE